MVTTNKSGLHPSIRLRRSSGRLRMSMPSAFCQQRWPAMTLLHPRASCQYLEVGTFRHMVFYVIRGLWSGILYMPSRRFANRSRFRNARGVTLHPHSEFADVGQGCQIFNNSQQILLEHLITWCASIQHRHPDRMKQHGDPSGRGGRHAQDSLVDQQC